MGADAGRARALSVAGRGTRALDSVGANSYTSHSSQDGAIAQLGERLHGMQEVGGSIPPGSTNPSQAFPVSLR